jgi:hypothetical protein
MPQVRFEPTIPAFERAKTVQALDRAATMVGTYWILIKIWIIYELLQQLNYNNEERCFVCGRGEML